MPLEITHCNLRQSDVITICVYLQLLQNAAMVITKCVSYYKMPQNVVYSNTKDFLNKIPWLSDIRKVVTKFTAVLRYIKMISTPQCCNTDFLKVTVLKLTPLWSRVRVTRK